MLWKIYCPYGLWRFGISSSAHTKIIRYNNPFIQYLNLCITLAYLFKWKYIHAHNFKSQTLSTMSYYQNRIPFHPHIHHPLGKSFQPIWLFLLFLPSILNLHILALPTDLPQWTLSFTPNLPDRTHVPPLPHPSQTVLSPFGRIGPLFLHYLSR